MTTKEKIKDYAIGTIGMFAIWFVVLWVATGQM